MTATIQQHQSDTVKYRNSIFVPASARAGFRHLLMSLPAPANAYIMLPGYIGQSVREGSGVLDPIHECGIRYAFYKVHPDLSADLDDLNDKIRQYKTFAVFVIHYFGFLQSDIVGLKALCRREKLFLIEDCAHSLLSSSGGVPLGSFGDFSLFSIHKTLPTPNGGILQANKRDSAIPLIKDKDKISFESLEIFATTDLKAISRVRISNYRTLVNLLSGINGIDVMYPDLPEGIVPLNVPVRIESKDRYQVYLDLQQEGVQTSALYYQLVSDIKKEEYPVSHEISAKILNLPIHQDLNEDDLHRIADKLKKVLS